MTQQQLVPKVVVRVEEVKGKHSEKTRYVFECEQKPVPEPKKKKGLAAGIIGSKPELRLAAAMAIVLMSIWISRLV